MNDFSNSVTSNTTQEEINEAGNKFQKKVDALKRKYDRLERSVNKNHIGMKTSGSLYLIGGITNSRTPQVSNTFGTNPDFLSFVYFSALTPPIPASAVILNTTLNVNVNSVGNFDLTFFGSADIRIRGGWAGVLSPNILYSNSSFSGSYSNSFSNAFPANPVNFRSILNSGSNAGFGIRALQPSGGAVSGTFSLTLIVNYYVPFQAKHQPISR
jgi:hypothetical protein